MKYSIRVAGGLANKMFHCAFAIAVKNRGNEVLIDTKSQQSEFSHDTLDLYKIFPSLGLSEMPVGLYRYSSDQTLVGKLMRRIGFLTGNHYYISHAHKFDSDFLNHLSHDGYVIGYFQNEKYFRNSEAQVRKAFSFTPIEGEKNIQISSRMKAENSVAIHVRKGDGYATWAEFKGTCPIEYYKEAVKLLKENINDNLTFYLFTDSPEWVADNFGWLDYTLVDWNPCEGWGNHFDMQLMSMCKHNIIANSTYSWWGAWLNNYKDKIVIAPKVWFNLNSRVKEQSEIVPETWIKL